MKPENYYLGVDIGTDSVGYAVTDTTPYYKLLKHKGEPMWGVTLFDAAETKAARRGFRTARRRLDRRQQRVELVRELFAEEIGKVDPKFYSRIKESALLRTDAEEPYCLFCDDGFTDREYHKKYPTVHHLIAELMTSDKPHDIRLVYIACAWLVAHRGHFLSDISLDNVDSVTDFNDVYHPLIEYFESLPVDNYHAPWDNSAKDDLETALRKKASVTGKHKQIEAALFPSSKCPKGIADPDVFPFSVDKIIRLLAGGKVELKDLYGKEEYSDLENKSISLGSDDETIDSVLREIGDDGDLLIRLKAVYDWSILCDLIGTEKYISLSKVKDYEQHKKDLALLKSLVKRYVPGKYNEVFRNVIKGVNYVSYSGNIKSVKGDISNLKKSNDKEEFGKYVKKLFDNAIIDKKDETRYNDMIARIDAGEFMPKQVTGENRVIPYQLYYKELEVLLGKASSYFPFLNEKDDTGLSVTDKLLSIMSFRIPYYVGPLNSHSEHAWIERKSGGRILPWNFEDKVDLDSSERSFIKRMMNKCTYLPDKDVLPKHSLLYEKFEVLNEINNIRINNKRIDVTAKQSIYDGLFTAKKKVTPKMIKDHLVINGYCTKSEADTLSGIDTTVKSSLSSHHAFSRLMGEGILNASEVEDIIVHSTFSEERSRFSKWLSSAYGKLSDADRKYICSLKFKDFGRLSKDFLCGIEGTDTETGEINTVIGFLWERNLNIMELLSEKYTFTKQIEDYCSEYYSENPKTLDKRLDDMYISNSVKRPIFRTLDIIHDVVKATGHVPEKVFIEMARGGDADSKGKRTKSRKQQLLDLYKQVKDEDVRLLTDSLEAMGDAADSRLQSEALFLYYVQLGKCMYSGEPIKIENLSDGTYNIDHIYPQSKVKDDSILNNKVLVLSNYNKTKGDTYPVPAEWRTKMYPMWKNLKDAGLMTEEKFNRLTRKTPFTEEESWGFINRQLVETRQSTKALASILKEKYPDTEIVYVKAGLVSEFRHEYDMHKVRSLNDLHHAKDAYLNIVCGNVYNEHFTRKWFLKAYENNERYNLRLSKLFGRYATVDETFTSPNGNRIVRKVIKRDENGDPVFIGEEVRNGDKLVWAKDSFRYIKKTVDKNSIHLTFYPIKKKHGQNGGLFDQNPLKKGKGIFPRKKELPTDLYGGYSGGTTSFDLLVRSRVKGRNRIEFVPVLLKDSTYVLESYENALDYVMPKIDSKQDEVEILFGARPIKIGTVFEIDGLRLLFSSQSSEDGRLGFKLFSPLMLSEKWQNYIRLVDSFVEKTNNKKTSLIYDRVYDKVNSDDNVTLYEVLLDKISKAPFSSRPENPSDKIKAKKADFKKITSIEEQCKCLKNLISLFGRSVAADKFLGTSPSCRLTSNLSNWKKYHEVRIVDMSPSGIWESCSENLLDLL